MANTVKGSTSKFFVWILLGLLVIGLGGFGVTNFGGSVDSVGSVGDEEIEINTYARELQQELRAFQAQTGQNISLSQAVTFGIDQAVLQRLLDVAALDNETRKLGLSVDDTQVARQVLAISAFNGADGTFDRQSYRAALQQTGLSESEFEERIRKDTARTMLQAAVVSGVGAPKNLTDAVLGYIGERRSFIWARIDETKLETPIPTPSEEQLKAYYQANSADFTQPELKRITYAWVTPDMLLDVIDIDEEALRQMYDDRSDQYISPERRLVEQLIFDDDAEAQAAKARLDGKEISFDALVEERGLTLADIDLGDVTLDDFDQSGDEIFAMQSPGVIGPLPTPLGPSLFRMNGILAGQEVTFEQARDALSTEFASDSARRMIDADVTAIEDLLAGGATLEELAEETNLELGSIDWWDGMGEQIAAYNGFRDLARLVQPGDFPELGQLEDGGIFAMRLDEIVEPALQPLDEVRSKVLAGWENQETEARLTELAETLVPQIAAGKLPSALGLAAIAETNVTRDAFISGAPADLIVKAFEMEKGAVEIVNGLGAVFIVRLGSILPPDTGSEDIAAIEDTLNTQLSQTISQDILTAFTGALEGEAGITINQSAINAVHAQFQ